jgi:hypothetical protein
VGWYAGKAHNIMTNDKYQIPAHIRKQLAAARRAETLARKHNDIPAQIAAFKRVQELSTEAFCHTQPS